jgi:hypothetical protein
MQNIKEKLDADLIIDFSKETEAKRIRYTLDRLDWFKKERYKVNLPKKIRQIVDRGLIPTNEEILEIVSLEFDQEEYTSKAQELLREWRDKKDEFLQKLTTLGLPLQSEYRLLFTKYGVGGSYGLPNNIQINFDYPNAKSTITTVLHEIIHLTIENLIHEYTVDH